MINQLSEYVVVLPRHLRTAGMEKVPRLGTVMAARPEGAVETHLTRYLHRGNVNVAMSYLNTIGHGAERFATELPVIEVQGRERLSRSTTENLQIQALALDLATIDGHEEIPKNSPYMAQAKYLVESRRKR